MTRFRRIQKVIAATSVGAVLALPAPAAAAGTADREPLPGWVKPAVRYLADEGLVDRDSFRPDDPMLRSAFTELMAGAFGGGYSRTKGKVTAGEVSAALVRTLGKTDIAAQLSDAKSPDGWDPEVGKRFGTEVVARELGLRHDRPTTEDAAEASAAEPMSQADIAWAVWQARTSPDIYAADALANFDLATYGGVQRDIVKYALSLVGTPYVWGGEWLRRTPDGYPYGAQVHGGVDCSGFIWYVLQAKSASYSPIDRPYEGWSIPERSSADMARATPREDRLKYGEMVPGDVVLFAPDGRDAKPADVYHAGLYLGEGWIVHSSGSRAGVSLAPIGPGSWWNDQIIFGRRVVTK